MSWRRREMRRRNKRIWRRRERRRRRKRSTMRRKEGVADSCSSD